jgi:hypothetical protein
MTICISLTLSKNGKNRSRSSKKQKTSSKRNSKRLIRAKLFSNQASQNHQNSAKPALEIQDAKKEHEEKVITLKDVLRKFFDHNLKEIQNVEEKKILLHLALDKKLVETKKVLPGLEEQEGLKLEIEKLKVQVIEAQVKKTRIFNQKRLLRRIARQCRAATFARITATTKNTK